MSVSIKTSSGRVVVAGLYAEAEQTTNQNHWTGTMAEYQAQKDLIPPNTIVNIIDDEASIQAVETYKTEEIVVGNWINKKPIYRKVVEFATPKTFTPKEWTETEVEVAELDIEAIISAWVLRNGNTCCAPAAAIANEDSDYVRIETYTEYANCATLILEYTKASDVPEQDDVLDASF